MMTIVEATMVRRESRLRYLCYALKPCSPYFFILTLESIDARMWLGVTLTMFAIDRVESKKYLIIAC